MDNGNVPPALLNSDRKSPNSGLKINKKNYDIKYHYNVLQTIN